MARVLVTGATGAVGGAVAASLAARGDAVRMLVRDRARAPAVAGAEIALGSYEDVASLEGAMAGIAVAFVVSAGGPPIERSRLHGNAIDAAARAGAHVVYLSFAGASPTSRFPYSVDHALTERHLHDSGAPWTVLRDSLYADLLPRLFVTDGVARGPAGDGRVAWVARDDVAEVAAAVLADPGAHAGRTFDVTGPEATTYADAARTFSAVTGRRLRFEDESVEDGAAWRRALGAPEWEVRVWLGSYLAARAGELEHASDTVARLTGHAPTSLHAWAERHPDAFVSLAG